MKKIFAAMLAIITLFTVNVSCAAKKNVEKFPALAEIDAYNFFRNMGYEVDCSYFETTRDGRQFYEAILPEAPLIFTKEFSNVEVFADKKKGHIVELRLYMKIKSDPSELTAMVAKAIKSLDADAFTANQAEIEKNIFQLMSTPQLPDDITVTINADRKYALHKEELRGRVLAVYIRFA